MDGFCMGNKPIVVIECVQEETYNSVELASGTVSVYYEYENKKFDYSREGNAIEPIQECEAEKGHIKVLQLHEKVPAWGT